MRQSISKFNVFSEEVKMNADIVPLPVQVQNNWEDCNMMGDCAK